MRQALRVKLTKRQTEFEKRKKLFATESQKESEIQEIGQRNRQTQEIYTISRKQLVLMHIERVRRLRCVCVCVCVCTV